MKKTALLTALMALSLGCNKEEKPQYEAVLSDSIYASDYSMEGEWSFDGTRVELSEENSQISISATNSIRGSYIDLTCNIAEGDERIFMQGIGIGSVLLSGEPGDVTFNLPRAIITYREKFSETADLVYRPYATVKGWIRTDLSAFTRLGVPVRHSYNCEIDIECEIDGKPLKVHITRMAPNYYY